MLKLNGVLFALLCAGCPLMAQATNGRGQLMGLSGSALERVMSQFPKATPGTATVSFTPQGGLPWLPPNVGTDYIIVCAPAGTSLAAGAVYQLANQHKISPLSPATVKSLLYQRKATNKLGMTINIAKDAALEIPTLGAAHVISMSTPWIVALLASNPTITKIENQFQAQVPDPSSTIDLLLDPSTMLLFSGPCFEATIGVVARKNPLSGTFTIQ